MHRVPNGEVYNCSRKTSDSTKGSRSSMCSPAQKALYRGAGMLVIWTISPAVTKSQVREVGFQ